MRHAFSVYSFEFRSAFINIISDLFILLTFIALDLWVVFSAGSR